MATPLFRPTIDTVFSDFLDHRRPKLSQRQQEAIEDVFQYFRQYLDQSGADTLPEKHRLEWEQVVDRPSFVEAFPSIYILPASPGFLADLIYQESVLPVGLVGNAQKTVRLLGRWLLAHELAPESDYVTLVESQPTLQEQLFEAEEMSSIIYDATREDPVFGKILDEVRGYHEIVRIRRGGLILAPLNRTDLQLLVRVPHRASSLARVGWWIDGRLVKAPRGWDFVDIGNALP